MSKEDKPWTKREKSVVVNPVLSLAEAVIRQWELDGKPKSDEEAIKYWKGVMQCSIKK